MSVGVVDGYVEHIPSTGTDTISSDLGTVSPLLITRVDAESESANIIHSNLNGSATVVLIGDRPQTGSLTLLFDNDNDMATARAMFRAPTTFTLDCPGRPVFNMVFVRSGRMSPALHDEIRNVWEFQIGYQEV
jgi:hypothetical protein